MASETSIDRETLEKFAQIVADSLRIDASAVTEDAYLTDLGAESLDLLEITMDVEDEFNILFPEQNILQTAQQVLGEGVLVSDGKLTGLGKRLVRARLPEFSLGDGDELTVNDLNKIFMRVSTWVRMIARLMEHTPKVCPSCNAAFGPQVAGRLTCTACGSEYDIPSGDDLNRQWVKQYCRDELQLS